MIFGGEIKLNTKSYRFIISQYAKLKNGFRVFFILFINVLIVISTIIAGVFLKHPSSVKADTWYNYDWAYRSKITIDHTKVGATLTDFPILVSSTNADWATQANGGKVQQANGQDFVFVASDQVTKLSHEIESYTTTTGNLIAWVKIPSLSSSVDAEIYLYYGNSGCEDQQNKNDVWSNGYKQSYHMGETSWAGAADEVKNSASVNYNGQAYGGATTTASGKIGYSGTFASTSSQYFQVAQTNDFDVPTSGSATMQGWIKTSQTDRSMYFGYYNGSGSYFWIENAGNGSATLNTRGTGFERGATKAGSYNDGNWHYIVGVMEQSGGDKNWTMYVDGQAGTTNTLTTTGGLVWSKPLDVGAIYNDSTADFFFNGQIDEYRYSLVARSSGWIATEYANQNSPGTFYATAATEAGDSSAPSNPSTINAYSTSGKTIELTDTDWASYANPYFEFSGAADAETGVKGYYVYFGTDSNANPYVSGIYQAHSGAASAVQNFTSSETLVAGSTYYFIIGTENNAVLQSTKATQFTYKYDPTAPSSPEYVNVSPVGCSTQTSFTFSWPAGSDTGGSDLAGYQYRRGSTGTVNDVDALTTTASSYQEGDNVFYLRSIDNAGNTSSWQTAVYCSTATVQVSDGPTVESGPSTMTVSWTSNKQTTSYVRVYEGNDYVSEQGQTSYSLTHSVKVVGLEPEKSYRYRLVWTDSGGNLGESDWFTTSTSTAPQINDLTADILGPTSTNISWKDSISAINVIQYGEGAYTTTVDTSGYATTGSYKLDNLTSGKTYQLRINATSEDGTKFFAGTSFTMPPLPEISSVSYEITNGGIPGAKVSWRTNVQTTSSLFYGPKGGAKTEIASSEKINDHTLSISSLPNSSTYEFYVAGTDAYGNSSQSSVLSFSTPADKRPPVISNVVTETSNVGLNKQDKAQIVVSWKTDEPSTSYVEYDKGLTGGDYTQKTGEDKAMTNSHLVIISDLNPAQPYHLRVASLDAGGNKAISEDIAIIAGDVPKSIFNIITDTFENVFGWLGKVI